MTILQSYSNNVTNPVKGIREPFTFSKTLFYVKYKHLVLKTETSIKRTKVTCILSCN